LGTAPRVAMRLGTGETAAMKLVQKLTAALVAGTCVVLATNGYLRVRRETATLDEDRVRDHDLIGHSLAAATEAVWRSDGRAPAIAMLQATNTRSTEIRIAWSDTPPEGFDAAALARTRAGEGLRRIADDDRRQTYVPVDVDGLRRGYIELSESRVAEHRRVRLIVFDTIAMTLALMLVSAAVSVALGFLLVGRPVRALAEKARRIGRGDFSGPVALRARDELGELAGEMNAMCEQLVEANERVAHETATRIATLEQLRHADRLTTVGKLASGVAHELGTPLNVVSARAAMIASGEATGAEIPEYARIIVDASKRMTAIIRQLLTFARRSQTSRARVDARALVDEALNMLRTLAKKSNASIALHGAGDATVDADAGHIQQVVTNLVVNAIQAMPSGGAIDVTIAREHAAPPPQYGGAAGNYVCIRVRDEGVGIPEGALEHIFEPFYTTKDVGEGTGLGLSVSFGIVQEHGGWITVDSEPGKGSTFRIYLPALAST
jgi:signal transduction histidine kinase